MGSQRPLNLPELDERPRGTGAVSLLLQDRARGWHPSKITLGEAVINMNITRSGYTHCACRDCMDTTVSSDIENPELCSECTEAGCEAYIERPDLGTGQYDCQRDDAYGTECVNGDGPCSNACQCGCESGSYECQCSHAYEG